MRLLSLALAAGVAALAACVAQTTSAPNLQPADAATALISGGPISMRTELRQTGQDPLTILTLARTDGRSMLFTQANHAPHDVMAQSAGGPLASVMGLFNNETPVLYYVRDGGSGAPFLCGTEGPQALGVYAGPSGEVSMVGLKSGFQFETRPDGVTEALPYSPDHVCARLKFQRR